MSGLLRRQFQLRSLQCHHSENSKRGSFLPYVCEYVLFFYSAIEKLQDAVVISSFPAPRDQELNTLTEPSALNVKIQSFSHWRRGVGVIVECLMRTGPALACVGGRRCNSAQSCRPRKHRIASTIQTRGAGVEHTIGGTLIEAVPLDSLAFAWRDRQRYEIRDTFQPQGAPKLTNPQ